MGERRDEESLKHLEQRLEAARADQHRSDDRPTGRLSSQGMGAGMRIAVEMVAAIVVGTAIGLVLDSWLGTKPWLFLLFFFLGIGAAFMNVMRVARELDAQRKQAANDAAAGNKNPK